MKILFISHDANYSGGPIALLSTVRSLYESIEDLKADVLFFRDGAIVKEFSRLCNVTICNNDEPLWHKLLRKVRILGEWMPDYVKQTHLRKYDLVYANSSATVKIAIDIKHKYGIPVLVHIHEAELLMKLNKVDADILRECDHFVAVSELCRTNLIENYGIQPDRIILQYPTSPWVDSAVRGQLSIKQVHLDNIEDDDFVVGFSGATYWLKSDDMIPLIIKKFSDRYPKVKAKFLVVGMCDQALDRIEFDCRKADIKDRTIVLGRVADPLDYYSLFDVFVLPSREESFSLVAAENAFLKKPIIAFRKTTGASEWLDEDSSIQVPYLDIDAIVDAIYCLYNDRQKGACLGDEAYRHLIALYKKSCRNEAIVGLLQKIADR